jgi:hypothetical protein
MMADSSVHSNEINTYIVKILYCGSLTPLIGKSLRSFAKQYFLRMMYAPSLTHRRRTGHAHHLDRRGGTSGIATENRMLERLRIPRRQER